MLTLPENPEQAAGVVQLRPYTANTILFLNQTDNALYRAAMDGGNAGSLNINDPTTLFALMAYVYIQAAPLGEVIRAVRGPREDFEMAVSLWADQFTLDDLYSIVAPSVGEITSMAVAMNDHAQKTAAEMQAVPAEEMPGSTAE